MKFSADLTGISLSDFVRLYMQRLDRNSTFVACADLVADTRLVSVRSTSALTPAVFDGVLRRHGYQVTQVAGVKYVCPASEGVPNGRNAVMLGSGSEGDVPEVPADPNGVKGKDSYETRRNDPFVAIAREGDSQLDRLIANGGKFLGCVGSGRILVGDQPFTAVTFNRREVASSRVGRSFQCRP